jgi:hypothetical protein
VPATASEAVDLADRGVLSETLCISVRRAAGERYDRIVDYRLGPKPAGGCDRGGFVLTEEIPF